MFHKEKAKQCANLLNEACLARMGGWEDRSYRSLTAEFWQFSARAVASQLQSNAIVYEFNFSCKMAATHDACVEVLPIVVYCANVGSRDHQIIHLPTVVRKFCTTPGTVM